MGLQTGKGGKEMTLKIYQENDLAICKLNDFHEFNPLPDEFQKLFDLEVLRALKRDTGRYQKVSKKLKKRKKWGTVHDMLQKLIEEVEKNE